VKGINQGALPYAITPSFPPPAIYEFANDGRVFLFIYFN
jgi:hypothetical protein